MIYETAVTIETAGSAGSEMHRAKGVVLLVGNFSPFGNRVCVELAERLSGAGWAVETTSALPRPVPRALDMLHTVWRRRGAFGIAQVDVYSGRAFFWAEAVCWALRRAHRPYVLTLHGGRLPEFAHRWPGRVRRLLRSAATVTTPSSYLAEQMRCYAEGLQVLPNAIDLSAYRFDRRRQLRPRLVWLRAFEETYNPSLAPRVVERLAVDLPDVQLAMIGPDRGDGSRQQTERIARESGIIGRIDFIGWIPRAEVPAALSQGDIFLNTTDVDNTPGSVLEAMACGLPVVSTNVGGLPYLLRHEHDALLIPPNDPEAMAAAVRRLLTEPGLAQRLAANARATVERFDFSVVLPQWESLLRGVVEARGH